MKVFIARAALLSTFAFGALLGGGIAFDGGQPSITGLRNRPGRGHGCASTRRPVIHVQNHRKKRECGC